MTYATLGKPRFTIRQEARGEALVIPAQKNILLLSFLGFRLCGWTVGGIAAMRQLAVDFHPVLAFWLCAWAIGWRLVSCVLSWMLTGRQRLRVIGADLEIETAILGFSHRALYRGRDIRGLKAVAGGGYWVGRQAPAMPLLGRSPGAVRSSYGARSKSTGFGLDAAEAVVEIDWLRKKLPEAVA